MFDIVVHSQHIVELPYDKPQHLNVKINMVRERKAQDLISNIFRQNNKGHTSQP